MSVAVVNKIETILHSAYHMKNYVDFIREIFPGVKMVAPDKFNKEYSNFSSHIEGYIHVGTFQTPDKKKILIMAVQQRKAGYVENARSTQRSFAKKLIENGNADAALIAFYTDGDPKWRLSLVRLDYEMKIENGHLKTAENLTPAKRYSYLVGQDEPCHTAISRFNQFITDSVSRPAHPTLDDLEEAFSVEKVTDEFFQLYCEKFHQLREQLESIEDFRIEAEQHNFTSAQFAKKLMGQIVFLYFLQKKGWLGVKAWPDKLTEKEYKNAYYARGTKSRELIPIVYRPVGDGTYRVSAAALQNISDADEEVLAQCVKGNPWGSGPRDFMRKLFNIAVQRKQNFYSELLEPLFYDTLNRNRGEQGYCPALHCRIPFLSGGLFEPIDGYDWEHNDFAIPNEVFSNEAIKGKRDADGILDIFDRYNFTMSEDEPMEREVAIDPEMLGKVFENLLEVKDRKSKGAFYTPREIVHYMCQESLINYLTNKLGISEEAIRSFILYGDYIKDQDTEKTIRVADKNGKFHMEFDFEKELYISEEILSFKKGVNRLLELDKALQDVRVADPAVGSGAFPLGMLNEIVRARQNISAYLTITMKSNDVRMMYLMDRAPHTLKYETIRNCIFAADIDPSAVDIAQLRLWLALVIDDEINPDAHNELEGHRNPRPLPNLECNILCGNSLIDEFEGIRLVKESNLLGSSQYQLDMDSARFDAIVQKLIEAQDELFRCADPMKKIQLKEEIESLRDMIILAQLEGCKPEVLEKYYASKRLASKPYVLWQLDFARVFREKGGFDIVIGNPPYFLYQANHKDEIEQLRKIEELKSAFGGKLNAYKLFLAKALHSLARNDGYVCYIFQNSFMADKQAAELRKDVFNNYRIVKIDSYPERDSIKKRVFEAVKMSVCIALFQKSNADQPFIVNVWNDKNKSSGTQTLYTKADIITIDPDTMSIPRLKQEFLPLIVKINGLPNAFHMKCYEGELNMTVHRPFFTKDTSNPKVLKGASIQRYYWTETMSQGEIEYVDEAKYLQKFQRSAKAQHHLFERIAMQGMTGANDKIRIVSTIVPSGVYLANSCNYILPDGYDVRYLLGVFNSKLINWYFRCFSTNSNVNGYEVDNMPIPPANTDTQKEIIQLVNSILDMKAANHSSNTLEAEKNIDTIVYRLYGLTDADIAVIENAR